jgi:acetyltransferase-like isoleucine patch superfamily enzyme
MWTKPKIIHNRPTKWNWMVCRPEYLTLGNRVDIGAFCYLQAQQGITIEDDVQIGSHCSIYTVSTIDGKQGKVLIKKNARIGTHSTVMPGITVGINSVVGAHSFVTCDIPDNEMWFGVPVHFHKII